MDAAENYIQMSDRGTTNSCLMMSENAKDACGDMTFCMSNYAKVSIFHLFLILKIKRFLLPL